MWEAIKNSFGSFILELVEPKPDIASLIATKVEIDEAKAIATDVEKECIDTGFASDAVLDKISAAALVRKVLARDMAPAELHRYVQHLQNRYQSAISPTAFESYKKDVPGDLSTDPDKLRAEADTLGYRLRLAYATSYNRDYALKGIRWWCLWGMFLSLSTAIAIVSWEWWRQGAVPFLNFAAVACLGLTGASASISRRAGTVLIARPFSEDPIVEASALGQGSAGLFVAAISGPVFAVILAIMFMAADAKLGELTPQFVSNCSKGDCVGPSHFQIFGFDYWLKDAPSAARLAVWSFAAGFLERLVPDILDRMGRAADRAERHK